MQKITKSLHCRIFFIFFFVICSQANAGLEVMIRNVGQGNYIAIKNRNKAIVVDCGVHQSGSYRDLESENPKINPVDSDPILNFLLGCEVNFFLTHTHYDHFSILPHIKNNAVSKGITIQSIYCSDFEPTESYKNLKKEISAIISVNTLADVAGIELLLGDGAKIEAVIPDPWPQVGKKVKTRSTDPNNNSLVLVVTDTVENKKFLFPGDATGLTLEYIRRIPSNVEKLKDMDCILIPHHGSNLAGAFDWFYFIKEHSAKQTPLLAIVSSDPSECDFLPWLGISQFNCFRILDEAIGYETKLHFLDVSSRQFQTKQPIFVTKNAISGFYHIISKNQSIQLFESGERLFLSNFEKLVDRDQEEFNFLLSENKLTEAGTKLMTTYGTQGDIPYELLMTISRYPFFRDLVISSLQQKLSGEFNINVLIKAAEYSELNNEVITAVIHHHNFIADEYLINLLQKTQFAKIINTVLNDRYSEDSMPLDTALKIAQYPSLTTVVTTSLEANRADITGSQLINLLRFSHVSEFAGGIFDSKLSEFGSISSEMIQVVLDMITKSERGIFAQTVYPTSIIEFATSHMWFEKINTFFSNSNPLLIPHETLVVAAQYPELSSTVWNVLSTRYENGLYLTEEEWLDYMRHTKKANNLELLQQLAVLEVVKE